MNYAQNLIVEWLREYNCTKEYKKNDCTFYIFLFYVGWLPALRCITVNYFDKSRTERNVNDLRGDVLFTLYQYFI